MAATGTASLSLCFFLLTMLATTSARALDIGQCGTVADITASLKAEGQHSFASGSRLTDANEGIAREPTLLGILITANDAGTLGYIVQTDKPLGEGATQACVHSRLANLRFYDARNAGIPQETLSKGSAVDARKGCDTLIRNGEVHSGNCRYLNDLLREGDVIGDRATVQADNLRRKPDGSYVPDKVLVTITATLTRADGSLPIGVGSLFNSTGDGATIMRFTLHGIEYTPGGEERLRANAR